MTKRSLTLALLVPLGALGIVELASRIAGPSGPVEGEPANCSVYFQEPAHVAKPPAPSHPAPPEPAPVA